MDESNTLGIPFPDPHRTAATRGARRLVQAPDDRDSLVAAGIYSGGRKISAPDSLAEAFATLAKRFVTASVAGSAGIGSP